MTSMSVWARTAVVAAAGSTALILGAGVSSAATPGAQDVRPSAATAVAAPVAVPAAASTTPSARGTAAQSPTMPIAPFRNALFVATCPNGLVPVHDSITAVGEDIHIDEVDYPGDSISIVGSTAYVHLTDIGIHTHHASFFTGCTAAPSTD
ncbi:hypothetical protein [Nakamurella endophytica]|uniref:Uncharacterized protein n=1 Tax=Nakamurella endophytica TaxID=1748367 RepID=A0A917SQG5_9ACTN|nr:hypothetical protein [Nakamurella endophytica]GGL91779.1 hypothetical protein GCM10011594_09470 [Nakamurella endophytica]